MDIIILGKDGSINKVGRVIPVSFKQEINVPSKGQGSFTKHVKSHDYHCIRGYAEGNMFELGKFDSEEDMKNAMNKIKSSIIRAQNMGRSFVFVAL